MTAESPILLNKALLSEALQNKNHHAVRVHLRDYLVSGGDANEQMGERALLVLSAVNGWVEETESLLARGADVHANDDQALRYAALDGHTDIVRLLLDHGADVHADTDSALRCATGNGHTDIVRLLLAHGADIHAENDVALRWAAINKHKQIIEVLLMAGASAATAVELVTRRFQCTVLATLDACAAAIPTDQRSHLLKVYGKQMPALTALVRQTQRRAHRKTP